MGLATYGKIHGDLYYRQLHAKVRRIKGSPKECEVCQIANPGIRYEWANLTGRYEDVDDYARMCCSCHRQFDWKLINLPDNFKSREWNNILTQEMLKKMLHYDPLTGVFMWLEDRDNHMKGTEAGHLWFSKVRNKKVRKISINSKIYFAHRLAVIYMTGSCPKVVDHKDRNPENNRWENLRGSSYSGNTANADCSKSNTSGVKGVHFRKDQNCWAAHISQLGKHYHLGFFDNKEDAMGAYEAKAQELFGEFARVHSADGTLANKDFALRRLVKSKSSSVPGLTWHKGARKWMLRHDKKYAGLFVTEEAALTYIENL